MIWTGQQNPIFQPCYLLRFSARPTIHFERISEKLFVFGHDLIYPCQTMHCIVHTFKIYFCGKPKHTDWGVILYDRKNNQRSQKYRYGANGDYNESSYLRNISLPGYLATLHWVIAIRKHESCQDKTLHPPPQSMHIIDKQAYLPFASL